MNNDMKVGVILGINLAVERMFKKVCDVMHVSAICKHETFSALSDDMETITELIERQRFIIEELGEELISGKSLKEKEKKEE